MISLQLVNSHIGPADDLDCPSGSFRPPLQLAVLSDAVERECDDVEIELLDGQIMSMEDICESLKPGIVAISSNTVAYASALRIAKEAKSKGAFVVIGGPHATHLGPEILRHRKYVDVAVRGPGESPLAHLCNAESLDDIDNICFRKNGNVVETKRNSPRLITACPNYGRFDLDRYKKRVDFLGRDVFRHRGLNMYSSRGCPWRNQRRDGCVFCSIPSRHYEAKSPSAVWGEISCLESNFGAAHIWDTADNYTASRVWLRELADQKPKGLMAGIHISAKAIDIDRELVRLLQRIGVTDIFIGFESGSDKILRLASKGCSKADNIRAISLLAESGIRLVAAFVLGLQGETAETLCETEAMIRYAIECAEHNQVDVKIAVPLPGSRMFKCLQKDLGSSEIPPGLDLYDLESLQVKWIQRNCQVTHTELLTHQRNFMLLSPQSGPPVDLDMLRPNSAFINDN